MWKQVNEDKEKVVYNVWNVFSSYTVEMMQVHCMHFASGKANFNEICIVPNDVTVLQFRRDPPS